MKQSAIKKLNDKKGMSLIFALLALLVVTLLSTTLISAALTGARRLDDDRNSRQSDLALDCAANLIKTELSSARYYSFENKRYDKVRKEFIDPENVPDDYFEGTLGNTLMSLTNGFAWPFEIKATSMPPVSVAFEKKTISYPNGSLSIMFYATLSVDDSGLASGKRSMVMQFMYGSIQDLEIMLEDTASVYEKSVKTTHYCSFIRAEKEIN